MPQNSGKIFPSAISWLRENKCYFSAELNGYTSPPLGPYLSTLPLIDRGGKILDLGCGNGMLLSFLMRFSAHSLRPYGVDINVAPIEQARRVILPKYKGNFMVGYLTDFNFKGSPFDIIITNPFYVHPQQAGLYIDKCWDNLNKSGRLILRVHDDMLKKHKVNNISSLPYLKKLPCRVARGEGLALGIIDK